MTDYAEEFIHSSRAPEKLRAAICFWLSSDGDRPEEEKCKKYLRTRIRPAVQALIRCEEINVIDSLAAACFFGADETDGFLRDASKEGKTIAVMYLLHLQKCQRQGRKSLFKAEGTNLSSPENPEISGLYRKLSSVLELSGSTPEAQKEFCRTGGRTGSVPGTGSGRGHGIRGDAAGTDAESLIAADIRRVYEENKRFDYHRVLNRFMEPAEVMELDPEGFDYISYITGLSLSDRLILTEPLEYREVNRLQELVIAIDTSASCSTETVRRFLAETWSVLSRRENFSENTTVYLIQCDMAVQRVDVLRSRDDWKRMIRSITIEGRSGTSFRPVFRFIEKEKEKGCLKNLKAVLYFTDGDGIYPDEKPDYETFFVFLKNTKHLQLVPSWAHALVIGETT